MVHIINKSQWNAGLLAVIDFCAVWLNFWHRVKMSLKSASLVFPWITITTITTAPEVYFITLCEQRRCYRLFLHCLLVCCSASNCAHRSSVGFGLVLLWFISQLLCALQYFELTSVLMMVLISPAVLYVRFSSEAVGTAWRDYFQPISPIKKNFQTCQPGAVLFAVCKSGRKKKSCLQNAEGLLPVFMFSSHWFMFHKWTLNQGGIIYEIS